jgi:hypothetical protein
MVALLLSSSLSLNFVACSSSSPPTSQAAKPTANAGQNQNAKVGQVVTLDGSASKGASPGDTLTYEWVFTSIPKGSKAALKGAETAKPTFTPDLAGAYAITLVVSSGGESSDPAKVTITVTGDTAKPTASATASKATVAPGDSVDLDGSASKAATAGATLTYLWSVKSEPAGSTVAISATDKVKEKLTVKLDLAGAYEFSLVVNDGTQSSDPAVAKVTAVAPAAKPTATIAPVSGATVNVALTLDGSGSKPAKAGDTLTYAWTITSGQTDSTLADASTAKSKFTATKAGTYKVQLVVSEGTVQSDPQSVTITAK